jgi:hypothetical protein
MSLDTFERILDKIAVETPNVEHIELFSWSEPFLHPDLPAFIRAVKARGWKCAISSNFNRIRNLKEVVAARPDWIRISLSGFTQEVYGQTHKGGDINTVKANMWELRQEMDLQKALFAVHVAYIRYKHNMGEDYRNMAGMARQLGFKMSPVWGYYMPAEKAINYYETGFIPAADKAVIELMAISPDEQKAIQTKTPHSDCPLRTEQVVINADGSVALCCAVYDAGYNVAASFLEVPFAAIQEARLNHSYCDTCMSHDMHKVARMANGNLIDEVAFANIGQGGAWPRTRRQVRTWWIAATHNPTMLSLRARLALGTRLKALRYHMARRARSA